MIPQAPICERCELEKEDEESPVCFDCEVEIVGWVEAISRRLGWEITNIEDTT